MTFQVHTSLERVLLVAENAGEAEELSIKKKKGGKRTNIRGVWAEYQNT